VSNDGSTVVSSINADSLYVEPQAGWGSSPDVPVTVNLSGEVQTPDSAHSLEPAGNAPIAISADGSTVAAGQGYDRDTPFGGVVNVYDGPVGGWAPRTRHHRPQ